MKRLPVLVVAAVGVGTILVLTLGGMGPDADPAGSNASPGPGDISSLEPALDLDANPESSNRALVSVLETNERILGKLESMETRLAALERDELENQEEQDRMQRERTLLDRARNDPKLVSKFMDVQRQSREKRAEFLGERFAAEPVDNEWSEVAEERLVESFANNLEANATLNDVECRSSMCRIELGLPGGDALKPMDFMQLELQLLQRMASEEGGPVRAFHRIEDNGLGGLRYITYASRGSRPLPSTGSPFDGMSIEEAVEYLENRDP